ncbi:collagen alpha-2(VIII) chain-like [Saccostrea cucullata]|uniref:collagen alpha-2(VIII) chain-like n=1 Tax=Saccostrea cuccullata TaxID=36930 RepID=UPI002ED2C231
MLMFYARCEKVSPRPGLKTFQEDYKSVAETCRSVGFFRKKCKTNADKSRKHADEQMAAFDVRLKNHKRNLATKTKVVFETVDLNEGQGYNASTGIFTAPYGGLYVFDWTTLAWVGQYAFTALTVNGSYKSWIYCHDVNSKTWLQCSKMAVVKLNHGDKVWIGVSQGPANMHRRYTSFSGYKL